MVWIVACSNICDSNPPYESDCGARVNGSIKRQSNDHGRGVRQEHVTQSAWDVSHTHANNLRQEHVTQSAWDVSHTHANNLRQEHVTQSACDVSHMHANNLRHKHVTQSAWDVSHTHANNLRHKHVTQSADVFQRFENVCSKGVKHENVSQNVVAQRSDNSKGVKQESEAIAQETIPPCSDNLKHEKHGVSDSNKHLLDTHQVKCGAVYVTDEERTKSVTKHVVSLSSSPEEKKKQKSSKYTVAIGSSFGHIHSFLKESDNVLKSYEDTKAEDKCLLLIKKPKSASKQSILSIKMLKAHSWADVSVGDMHIRNSDGSFKQDPYKTLKDRFKKKSDLSLPPDEWNSLPNQKTPFRASTTNQNSSFNVLSSVDEGKEDNKSDILVHKKCSGPVSNISNSYPFIKRGNNRKCQSLADLTEAGTEINNNKRMGGALSQVQGHQRPKVPPPGPPPPKPQRTHAADKPVNVDDNRSVQGVVNKGRNGNRPDVLCNVSVGNNTGNKNNHGRDRRAGSDPQKRVKHDSGFHSEAPLSSDELYDAGFKQDLSQCVRNGKQMTSSPIAVESVPQNSTNHVQRNYSNPRAQPQATGHGYNQSNSGTRNIQSAVERVGGETNARKGYNDVRQGQNNSFEHNRGNTSMGPSSQTYSEPVQKNQNARPVEQIKHNVQVGQNPVNRRPDPNRPASGKKNSPVQQQNSTPLNESRSRSSEKPIQRRSNEFKSRKSLGNVTEGQMLNINNQDSVTKAQSLGDLSVGCTFSLVGQKKMDSPNNSQASEFTGTQLMKHIRNYRDMTQNGKNENLPFKGKTMDDMDSYGQYNQGGQEQVRRVNPSNKLKHYGSLQHLPVSCDAYKSQSTPNNPKPVHHREKTPLKPRRLPQTPGDVHEKKRQITDMMKSRMSVDSSSTSPSSVCSNRGASIEPRPGGISATPSVSDREVSELFHGDRNDKIWKHSGIQNVCNNVDSKSNASHVPPSYNETCSMNASLHKSGSFGLHDQGHVHTSGGRLSESGQTTLTSQSTIDSGYITNDPDPDTLSTSSYAKTLKQSAQSLYVSSKLYHPTKTESHQSQNSYSKQDNQFEFNGVVSTFSKGDHSQQTNSNMKGGNSNYVSGNYANVKHYKDSHTRNWLANHPGTYVNDPLKLNPKSVDDKTDKNNNRHPNIPEDRVSDIDHRVSDIDLSQSLPHERLSYVKQPLSYHKSEVSAKDMDRQNQGSGNLTCKSKGKSISMSQGLNMIAQEHDGLQNKGSFLSKSHTKFTGSLKDLIGTDKQIIPIETLRLESANSTQTLPGSWKFQTKTRSESSLKFLGKPSVFQLLQNYNLYAVRMRIPENFVIMENIRVIECEVVLSTPWIYGKDSTSPMSPKGSYAKLGGPNSAFRPVAMGGASPIKSVSMLTVMEASNQLTDMIESGQLQKGDLLIEVNEMLMMGEDLPTLSSALQSCQGELLLTVARDKARESAVDRKRNSSSPTDDDFRRMEQKLTELTTELRKKDRTLKQLSALLPWKLPTTKGNHSAENKDQDGYMCSLSEDEFIV